MSVLVTGGAGYIGSHAAKALLQNGEEVIIVDTLEKGYRTTVDRRAKFFKWNCGDMRFIGGLVRRFDIKEAMHFAAYIDVTESVRNPEKYEENNVMVTKRLATALKEAGVTKAVFSSSAAVYGIPSQIPIPESALLASISPYGDSKIKAEAAFTPISCVSLRYFNAAGSAYGLGESHRPETHLIPKVIRNSVLGSKPAEIYGADFDTPDGTALRDYVHIQDLVDGHIAALEYLRQGGESAAVNLGAGKGYSVKQVLDLIEKLAGKCFQKNIMPRRPGDPPALVADIALAKKILDWAPKKSINETVRSAYEWLKANPLGY